MIDGARVVWPAVAGACHSFFFFFSITCGCCHPIRAKMVQVLVGSRGVTLIQSFRQETSQSTHGRTLHVLQLLEWRTGKFTVALLLGECSMT
jgi:hypothetical protein